MPASCRGSGLHLGWRGRRQGRRVLGGSLPSGRASGLRWQGCGVGDMCCQHRREQLPSAPGTGLQLRQICFLSGCCCPVRHGPVLARALGSDSLSNIHDKCLFPLFLPLPLPAPVFCWDCTDNSGIACAAWRCQSVEEPLKCRGIFELLFPSAPQRCWEVRLTGQSISEIIPSLLPDDISEVQN